MKCSEICYRLRWHTLLLAALLAAGCAAQLTRGDPALDAHSRCPPFEYRVCEQTSEGRACSCLRRGDLDTLGLPATTNLGL